VTARTFNPRRCIDAAVVRRLGPVAAITLARTEDTACRRASVALGLPGEHRAEPAVVAGALAEWLSVRGKS
jgi:hypothetical protein